MPHCLLCDLMGWTQHPELVDVVMSVVIHKSSAWAHHLAGNTLVVCCVSMHKPTAASSSGCSGLQSAAMAALRTYKAASRYRSSYQPTEYAVVPGAGKGLF